MTDYEVRGKAAEMILEEMQQTRREFIDYESSHGSNRLGPLNLNYDEVMTRYAHALADLLRCL